ncbi:unnamed protein product [Callosobruchus maculatus]|uniref:Major facilitator superfamily (MFS) profile domain-containing protein n=1 Tax=Callosobruchus maculatus TaxID=64391 RepID=A0A653BGP8_CALMS|nr:unnamed protein product [Callosobruchus maculatus]
MTEVVYKPTTQLKDGVLLESENAGRDLYLSTIIASLVITSAVCSFIWMSPALIVLKSTDPNVNPIGRPVTPLEESIIGGIWLVGVVFGNLSLSRLPDVFGRKKIIMFVSILLLASFLLLAFASNVYLLYLGRFLTGFCFGMYFPLLSIYVSEISGPRNRGKFGGSIGFFITLGGVYTFALAPFFSLPVFTLLCTLPLTISIACFIFIPETPVQLVSKGNMQSAEKILKRLRGRSGIQNELEEIQATIRTSGRNKGGEILPKFKSPGTRKALVLAIIINTLQRLVGHSAFLGYLHPVLAAGGVSPKIVPFLTSLMLLPLHLVSATLTDRLGRRPMLLFSVFVYGSSVMTLGVHFYFQELHYTLSNALWIPITCMALMFGGFTIGMGMIPTILASEILPDEVKSFGMSLANFASTVGNMVAIFTFPIIMEFMGLYWCCWLSGMVSLFTLLFVFFFVPETKGKTVLEIQKMFSS